MTKTQQDLLRAFTAACSADRLSRYRRRKDSDGAILTRYLWNILLSEALYPTLQTLEVTLRNSLHDAISAKYQRQDWYDIPHLLEPFGQRDVAAAKQKLTVAAVKKKLKPSALHTPGRVVAELTFGFWTGLLSSDYETNPRFWPVLVVPVFPYAPHHLRSRRALARVLHPLRYLRNRVFHHEPIWNTPQLTQHHADILNVIRWINADVYDAIVLFDRFPPVSAGGQTYCLQELKKIMT